MSSVRLPILCLSLTLAVADSAYAERLKDLADLHGARPNHLIGYGLVVGLAGTGDDATTTINVETTLTMLKKLGIQIADQQYLYLRNVAAVMVTAEMPAFSGAGEAIDVLVSSIGNAAASKAALCSPRL